MALLLWLVLAFGSFIFGILTGMFLGIPVSPVMLLAIASILSLTTAAVTNLNMGVKAVFLAVTAFLWGVAVAGVGTQPLFGLALMPPAWVRRWARPRD